MKVIGVTGGIGSGKSTVCRAFSLLNVPVFNADENAKWLIMNDEAVKSGLIELFGNEAYQADGTYNRSWVAEQVFYHPDLLQQLNAVVHPRVHERAGEWMRQFSVLPYVLYEAAVMNAAGNGNSLDYVLLVSATVMTRTGRVLHRDPHRTPAAVTKIMENQRSDDEFRSIADFVVENNDDDLVLDQVLRLDATFRTLK